MPRRLRAVPLAVLVLLLCGSVPANGQQSLRDAASRLKAAVRAEEARIADTRSGLADANARLAVLDARLQKRNKQLDDTQTALVRARVRLSRLERKQANAEKMLAQNLRSSYMDGEPTFVGVVLQADGFEDLIERFEYLRRISRRNASVLGDLRGARKEVAGQAVALKKMRTTYAALAKDAAADRDRGDAIRTALLNRERAQLARRAGTASRLASVQGRIAAIERRQRAAARAAAAASSATTAAQRSWKRWRRSASETGSPDHAWARKYWRCSSKALQKHDADTKLPKPRIG
jgi:peptidoglycan hydrolase CwlO-like protein